MSYRSFKRLLGETSLERKCRFLFGGGLLILIGGSFYFYAQLNARLIQNHNLETGRLLVSSVVMEHIQIARARPELVTEIRETANSLKPPDIRERLSWSLLAKNVLEGSGASSPMVVTDYDALDAINGGAPEYVSYHTDENLYRFYAPVFTSKNCTACHDQSAAGSMLGLVKISLPLDKTKSALATNNAILLAMAIVTAFLAMVAAYAIVRYIIVKPALHLKDVSDEIARGNLELRAEIRTGDEFEELGHAFNRMLRHLVNTQDELKQANTELDTKVDELARANMTLFELNKVKSDFLATMSHELRTPLNAILGFADVLEHAKNMEERQKRYLANISKSGRDLLALIEDILDLAKIESGKMEVKPTEFSFPDLLREQTQAMQSIAERKNIDLSWSAEPDFPTVDQDAVKVRQVVVNLLSNALKFTPEGGRVRVQCYIPADDSTVFEFLVEDTGIGIRLDDQERIFDKFRQARISSEVEATLTREHGGTGLGLSIVKELCRLLRGEIRLESEIGKGSRFFVRLPLVFAQASTHTPQVPARAPEVVFSA